MSLSLLWSVGAMAKANIMGGNSSSKRCRAGQVAQYPGKDIESDPLGFQGLNVKKAAWLCGDHVEKEGWAFCSCKGRETCD